MEAYSKQKFRLGTIIYWVLLSYIIAALIWWAISLFQQNREMYTLKKAALVKDSPSYLIQLQTIEEQRQRNVLKYVGEGSAFLLLILIGAGFLYHSVHRQFAHQQQQQNFMMAITHELKTPIAISRLNLETLQKHKLDEEKKQKLVYTALQETHRLDTLINNILIASQLEDNGYVVAKEELNFSALVNDMLRTFCNRYPNRRVIPVMEEEVEIKGDTELLKLLVSNLLENANKYSCEDKPITVELKAPGNQIIFSVVDEGPGIPAHEKKAVFQKFYRIGNEETRKTQGTGLGLYICKKIVTDHHGVINIRDNQPRGSKFMVQFFSA